MIDDATEGVIYLLHLDPPYRHARHYMGWSSCVADRLETHRLGQSATLLRWARAAGVTWRLVRIWTGNRRRKRQTKQKALTRLCPVCRPPRRPGGRRSS